MRLEEHPFLMLSASHKWPEPQLPGPGYWKGSYPGGKVVVVVPRGVGLGCDLTGDSGGGSCGVLVLVGTRTGNLSLHDHSCMPHLAEAGDWS